jgi:hypothetical protein
MAFSGLETCFQGKYQQAESSYSAMTVELFTPIRTSSPRLKFTAMLKIWSQSLQQRDYELIPSVPFSAPLDFRMEN